MKDTTFWVYYDKSSFLKQEVINYLTLFDINEATSYQLAEDVFASGSFDVLILFLKNYKSQKENDAEILTCNKEKS